MNVSFLHQWENWQGNDLLVDRIAVGTGQVLAISFLVPRVLVYRAIVNVDADLLVAKMLENRVATDA